MTWVKICGTTSLEDAQLSAAAGADALGFIFAESPRQVTIDTAAAIISALPHDVEAIGVFVNETPDRTAEVARQAGLTGVQLHGEEPAEQLREYRRALGDRKIIKTLQARELSSGDREKLTRYLSAREDIDAILLDSGSPTQRGGTGVPFSWQDALPLATSIRDVMPLIVAGGLSGKNVSAAIAMFQPWGVDVVSGVESEPGKRDEAKLRGFVAAVRGTHTASRQRAQCQSKTPAAL